MPGTTAVPDIELVVEDGGGGGGGPTSPPGGGGDGDDGSKRRRPGRPPSPNRYYTGITLGIVSILMFFMALASAFLVRRGTSGDWIPVHLPAVLWLNTLALVVSSFTLERARRSLSRLNLSGFRKLWMVTTTLGALFLIGQLVAWRQLVVQGVFMASNPASSFFYIFTAATGCISLVESAGCSTCCFASSKMRALRCPRLRKSLPTTGISWMDFGFSCWLYST